MARGGVERGRSDLQPEGQSAGGQAGGQGDGRVARQVEGNARLTIVGTVDRIVIVDARGQMEARDTEGGIKSGRCHAQRDRSEEHTSELQSLMRISYAVFCLKKKKKKRQTTHDKQIRNSKKQT